MRQIQVVSLVSDATCPCGLESCQERLGERQRRRDAILAAYDQEFGEAPPALKPSDLARELRAD